MENSYQIRDACPDDAPGITEIYNDAVTNTKAIWNESLVTPANRSAWLSDRQEAGYPVLVAIRSDPNQVLAFASYGPWRPFDGYRHTVELSVYVHPDHRGAGIGKALLEALIERARQAGKHVMIAAIEAGNTPSILMHERLGFRESGRIPEVGCKFGEWLDLVFMHLQLDTRATPEENA